MLRKKRLSLTIISSERQLCELFHWPTGVTSIFGEVGDERSDKTYIYIYVQNFNFIGSI